MKDGYHGLFDYSFFNANLDDAEYIHGSFKLYQYDGVQRVLLEAFDGQEVGRFDLGYDDGILTLDGTELIRQNVSLDDGALVATASDEDSRIRIVVSPDQPNRGVVQYREGGPHDLWIADLVCSPFPPPAQD